MSNPITITRTQARRLAVAAQRLHATPPLPTSENMLALVQQMGCLQLDPISAVSRSHTLVLWSRLGSYDLADFDRLLWEDKSLFEYWAHAASIVLTEQYPVHHDLMRRYPGESEWGQQTRRWMDENSELRMNIIDQITRRGPLGSKDLEDNSKTDWQSTGWTGGRNVSRMLDFLWTDGTIMVAGRKGGQKLWDLTERFLPPSTPRDELTPLELTLRAVRQALTSLGIAHQKHILQHFTRGRYPELAAALKQLEASGEILPVQIKDGDTPWKGDWFMRSADLPLLEQVTNDWQPRTTLLSPFDNLIADRVRTKLMFDFDFKIEIYVPKEKRQFGYYVLPILHGDQLVGRIDPQYDRKTHTLHISNIYVEPGAPADAAKPLRANIESLGAFLGAKQIEYPAEIPVVWAKELRP
jgi:uncharacterized protein